MSVKKKSLFDHIKQITSIQNPNYWNDISEDDKKTWSNYMVHRFLSMNMDWIELVNELQKYNLKPKELYKLYTNVIIFYVNVKYYFIGKPSFFISFGSVPYFPNSSANSYIPPSVKRNISICSLAVLKLTW